MAHQPLKSALGAAALAAVCAFSGASAQVQVLVNNVGYEKSGAKRAVVQSSGSVSAARFYVLDAQGGVVDSGDLGPQTTVGGWGGRSFRVADFSSFDLIGDGYTLKVGDAASPAFSVGEKVLQAKTGADQVGFFYGMRNTSDGDRNLPVFSRTEPQPTHNIYGGWNDATGDQGKHLSHLSFANYFNPQQIPFVAWALLHAIELQPDVYGDAAKREAAWGADYLLRSLAPGGFFYMSVFDNWGWGYTDWDKPENRVLREICAWSYKDGIRSGDYRSAMREGGGVSIAALARAAKAGVSGDSGAAKYLAGAKRAYAHLKDNPTQYQDDGKENIIDYYCGLLAASELFSATNDEAYRADAREWAEKLLGLQSEDGWFYSVTSGGGQSAQKTRPFYHAADEGLPVTALARYVETCEPGADEMPALRAAIGKNLRWYNKITYGEGANPFEYVKMYRADSVAAGGAVGGNLALNRTATASREEGSYTTGKAFDGSSAADSRWSSYQSGAQNDSQWIMVDLGDVYKVNRVMLNWEKASGKHYRIDVSVNGTDWNTVFVEQNNTNDGEYGRMREHTFTDVDAKYVRMFGITRNLEYGGFSLYEFEVYGEREGPVVEPASSVRFFMPQANETGYWWQGENARIASLSAAFIMGAPIADPSGKLWYDTLFAAAAAQFDWILGRNPFGICMMQGHGDNGYPNYPGKDGYAFPNVKGGICNGITAKRADQSDLEWAPYLNTDTPEENWRWIEQWLPHNAWYLTAVSALSYRIDNPIEEVSVKYRAPSVSPRLKISALRGRSVRVELPFAADQRTEVAVYGIQGKKLYTYNMPPGVRSASIRIPSSIARGAYILSVSDMAGQNRASGRVYLR